MSRIYGLPKIHKSNIPLRPVVPTIGTPTYFLAKQVSRILNNVIKKPPSYIKNSFELIQKISNLNIPDGYILISLDATSLFTNIPTDLIEKSIDRRCCSLLQNTRVTIDDWHEVIEFLSNNTYFQFNGKYYHQKFGTPMGSPVSSIFSDMTMSDLKQECLSMLSFQSLFYVRYVDDVATCIPEDKVQEMLDVFNSYHPRIQFTHELETNRALNFLELSLIRHGNQLITNWYKKPTSSGKILNFHSNHLDSHKVGMVYNLVDKAIKLSHNDFHSENLKIVKQILTNNDYPEKFIKYYMKKRIHHLKYNNNNSHNSNDILNTNSNYYRLPKLRLPYVRGFYERTRKKLSKFNILTVPKIGNKLNNVVIKAKDKIPTLEQTNVVYKINCKKCPKIYIGETKREVQCRMSDHQKDINKDPKFHSVVTKHRNNGHEFDWNRVEILDKEPNYQSRLTSEMIHISLNNNTLNKKTDTNNLHEKYINLLNKLKT